MTAMGSIPGWTSRRAARFADLVDTVVSHESGPARAHDRRADPRLEELLATVAALRSVAGEAPPARPAFVADLRERLMAEADTALRPSEDRLLLTRQTTTRRRPARLVAAGAALVIAGGTAGVAVAAENSLPGQSLYTLKQGLELTGRSLQLGQADRGRYELGEASTRLDEVTELVRRGDDDQVAGTLKQFTASAGTGADALFTSYQADSDPADVAAVRSFTASAMDRLDALSGNVPRADQPQLRSAAALLSSLDQEAHVLCAECGSSQALAVPYSLDPVPVGADEGTAAALPAEQSRQTVATDPAAGLAGTTPSAAVPGDPSAAAAPTASAGTKATTAAGGVSGTVKSTLPKVVGSAAASQAASALDGGLDAATGVVGGTLGGTVNSAAGTVTGLLGTTPTP